MNLNKSLLLINNSLMNYFLVQNIPFFFHVLTTSRLLWICYVQHVGHVGIKEMRENIDWYWARLMDEFTVKEKTICLRHNNILSINYQLKFWIIIIMLLTVGIWYAFNCLLNVHKIYNNIRSVLWCFPHTIGTRWYVWQPTWELLV